jgi:hypothetical protein
MKKLLSVLALFVALSLTLMTPTFATVYDTQSTGLSTSTQTWANANGAQIDYMTLTNGTTMPYMIDYGTTGTVDKTVYLDALCSQRYDIGKYYTTFSVKISTYSDDTSSTHLKLSASIRSQK